MSKAYRVMLECGHWFTEWRPDKFKAPIDGEKRSCGAPLHYPVENPNKWRALYQRVEEQDH